MLALGLALFACGPTRPGGTSGSTSSGADEVGSSSEAGESTGESTSSSSESDASESETSDAMPDACPAEPALASFEVLLDGHSNAISYYTEFVDTIIWTHACTVTSNPGSLPRGETIELACIDERAQAVEHTIELRTAVDGVPNQAPVAVGQAVELALWIVYFGQTGTVAWTLRDGEQNLLLLYYDGAYLPAPSEMFAVPLEHVTPLLVDVNHDVCPWYCPEESGGFDLDPGCCRRETALRIDLGQGVVEVQDGTAAAIPGGAHAIVRTSEDIDLDTCSVTDLDGTAFEFLIVGTS